MYQNTGFYTIKALWNRYLIFLVANLFLQGIESSLIRFFSLNILINYIFLIYYVKNIWSTMSIIIKTSTGQHTIVRDYGWRFFHGSQRFGSNLALILLHIQPLVCHLIPSDSSYSPIKIQINFTRLTSKL